jgi:transposase-like protein
MNEDTVQDDQQQQASNARRRFPMSFRKEVLNYHFSRLPPSVHATAKQFNLDRKTVKGWIKKYSSITVMAEGWIFFKTCIPK